VGSGASGGVGNISSSFICSKKREKIV